VSIIIRKHIITYYYDYDMITIDELLLPLETGDLECAMDKVSLDKQFSHSDFCEIMLNIVIESVNMAAANVQVFSISPIDLHVSRGDSSNNGIDVRPDLFVYCSFSNSV